MSQTIPLAPADRLALIIEGLCQAVARRIGVSGLAGPRLAGPRLAGPFIILIWSRLRRITARFARHAATPSPLPSHPEAVITTLAKPSRRRPASASPPLPRRAAWLLRLVPEAASGASQLRHFLADPEVTALLAEAPQLSRILRPLCHMLGIRAAGIRAAQALSPPTQAPDPPPIPCPAPPCHPPPQPAAPQPAAPWQAAPQATPIIVPPWTTPPSSPDAQP